MRFVKKWGLKVEYNMNTLLIIFGAIVVFCVGILIGFEVGKSDRIIIKY